MDEEFWVEKIKTEEQQEMKVGESKDIDKTNLDNSHVYI